MRQTWRDLTFLHWRYDPAVVRPLVPGSLQLDLFDGAAWVGLIPFSINDLTLPHAPALPWLSNFPETNVRTYVIDPQGRRAVWFFSLDAARLLAVIGARTGYALPYFWARMSVERHNGLVHYLSRRLHSVRATSDIRTRPGQPIALRSDLDLFLTARFRLCARRFGRIVTAGIEHPPWPLHRAEVVSLQQTLVQATGLPAPGGAPLVHFSPCIDVRVAAPSAA